MRFFKLVLSLVVAVGVGCTNEGLGQREQGIALVDAAGCDGIICNGNSFTITACCKQQPPIPAFAPWTFSAALFEGGLVETNPVRATGQNATGTMRMTLPLRSGDAASYAAVSLRVPSGTLTPVQLTLIRTTMAGVDTLLVDFLSADADPNWQTFEVADPSPRALFSGESLTFRVSGFGVQFGNVRVR